MNFDERPILVFWESTRACLLACRHCRAEAMERPADGELSTAEGFQFIDSLKKFGRPYPVLIITGGDALMRSDVFDLVSYARSQQIPVGLAPSVTPRLTDDSMRRMADLGVKAVSISLDGAIAATHEGVRGIAGHFEQTVAQLKKLVAMGFEVQVNTAVMKENVKELPALVQLLKEIGVKIWEVFFLIQVGRGKAKDTQEISAKQTEDVSHFLFEASAYDLTVRTVEAPFFRRVVTNRRSQYEGLKENSAKISRQYGLGMLYREMSQELRQRLGVPTSQPKAQTSGTRDGKGIVFVAYDGSVYPAGFLPFSLGRIQNDDVVNIYRNNPVLQDIRRGNFKGKCGSCDYRDLCGGSRSRAYAYTGDVLGADPACAYEPEVADVSL
ncbi:TIGR04053 family radical SAM/SPASM domain-containing protein [Alicyclobacillus sp. SO9]|uniref:TIGR04053 family radical SAM/SPASM domain-containing protein n=1 Tax=Alicyclobacillus sp. SO9 TaxID=2665646 RepID=UPI001E3B77EA|nr:TIGR04053 family radical SAM/SPASM domain-containing protein [Alicyclobacillus sp. SO9]